MKSCKVKKKSRKSRKTPTPKTDLQLAREQLPVYQEKKLILDSVAKNQTIILVGETG
jgi:HrpA-like RNA helicase